MHVHVGKVRSVKGNELSQITSSYIALTTFLSVIVVANACVQRSRPSPFKSEMSDKRKSLLPIVLPSSMISHSISILARPKYSKHLIWDWQERYIEILPDKLEEAAWISEKQISVSTMKTLSITCVVTIKISIQKYADLFRKWHHRRDQILHDICSKLESRSVRRLTCILTLP